MTFLGLPIIRERDIDWLGVVLMQVYKYTGVVGDGFDKGRLYEVVLKSKRDLRARMIIL